MGSPSPIFYHWNQTEHVFSSLLILGYCFFSLSPSTVHSVHALPEEHFIAWDFLCSRVKTMKKKEKDKLSCALEKISGVWKLRTGLKSKHTSSFSCLPLTIEKPNSWRRTLTSVISMKRIAGAGLILHNNCSRHSQEQRPSTAADSTILTRNTPRAQALCACILCSVC